MKSKIATLINSNPGSKSKDIAKKLQLKKSDVNSLLYKSLDEFRVDSQYKWYVRQSNILNIKFKANCWIDSELFEKSIQTVPNIYSTEIEQVVFEIPQKCKMLLDSSSKLLALCNQLVDTKKQVSLDFSNCIRTMTYFDRNGFFDRLHLNVNIIPSRPEHSKAISYKGNNSSLVEFGMIDLNEIDESIPKQLKTSFVNFVGDKYSVPAFTVISEHFGNVIEHSETKIPGFAALQYYKNSSKPHIQTVISDNGIGIVGSLNKVLSRKYPELYMQFDLTNSLSASELIVLMFESGLITSSYDDGRGLGLKKSRDVAAKFNANISIRQENFEVVLNYKNGKLDSYKCFENLIKLKGTHICFDFFT